MSFVEILLAFGIPSSACGALLGFLFWGIQKRLDAHMHEMKEQDKDRKKFQRFLVKGLTATMSLSEANATALRNGKCNGETKAALEYMKANKHELRDFLDDQGIDHLF